MAADAGFVGAEAAPGGGWRERAEGFLLHVDSAPRVGCGAPARTSRHLRTGANSCNWRNEIVGRVIIPFCMCKRY